MRVFVTGGTGFIGEAVVRELLGAGHRVLALARSERGEQALHAAGAEVHRGELARVETLTSGAKMADAVIHLAFDLDFAKFTENSEMERRAIGALGEALRGTGKVLLVSSATGAASTAVGHVVTEDEARISGERDPEAVARAFEGQGVRVGIVRLPQVHDTRKAGLVTHLIAIARKQGFVAYVGDGSISWPAAHVTDVARLYRLAAEKIDGFARYHAVAEEGVPMRVIADVVGKGLRLPLRSITEEEADAHFGRLGRYVSRDLRASSAKTRRALGWQPIERGLLEDLNAFEWV